jgi:hypothetical protein
VLRSGVAVGLGDGDVVDGLGDGGGVGVGLGELGGEDGGLLVGVLDGLAGADGRGPGLGRVACLSRWCATAEPPGEARLGGGALFDARTWPVRWCCLGTADAGAVRVGVGTADLVTMATGGCRV